MLHLLRQRYFATDATLMPPPLYFADTLISLTFAIAMPPLVFVFIRHFATPLTIRRLRCSLFQFSFVISCRRALLPI